MALQTHLKRRNGAGYSARMMVPLDVREAYGKKELQKSLGTNDPSVAKKLVGAVIAEWHREFDELRRRRDVTEEDLAGATWDHYSRELAIDEFVRALPPEVEEWPGRREHSQDRSVHLKTLREHLGAGLTVLIDWAAEEFIEKHQLTIKVGSSKYRELCFRLMRAQIEALQRVGERDQGDYAGRPVDPVVVRPAATAEVARPGEAIMDLFGVYERENPKRIASATMKQARRDIGTFVDLVGADFPVSKLDKKAVREWKTLLQSYPVKAAEMTIFKGKSFRQIIAANAVAEQPRPVINHKTVNRYMAGFGGFCNWLAAHDYIAANPFSDMYLSVDKTSSKEVFSPDQLNTLFASPLFSGCRDDGKWHVAGDHKIRDHRYWLPLVMMYSGARPGEIAQLLVADVRQQHDQWVMHVTDEGDEEKRLKTAGSYRVLPVHSELVRLGFIDFHQQMLSAGERRLFPEAERNSEGQIAAKFEKKFSSYLIKLGIKVGRGLSLYSFRHGFSDAMKRADYMNDDFGFLMGHSAHSMTERYGKMPEGTLRRRVEMIEKVSYPGLVLPSK